MGVHSRQHGCAESPTWVCMVAVMGMHGRCHGCAKSLSWGGTQSPSWVCVVAVVGVCVVAVMRVRSRRRGQKVGASATCSRKDAESSAVSGRRGRRDVRFAGFCVSCAGASHHHLLPDWPCEPPDGVDLRAGLGRRSRGRAPAIVAGQLRLRGAVGTPIPARPADRERPNRSARWIAYVPRQPYDAPGPIAPRP